MAPSNGSEVSVRELQLEVLRLETKLRDLHGIDTVATKRALDTLQQHVRALQLESKGIAEHARGLDVDPFSQHVVEEELTAVSATALGTYLADRVLKASQVLDSGQLRGALWILSGTYVTWRVTLGFWQKLRRRVRANAAHQQELQSSCQQVADRVEVMGQLLPPETGQSRPSDDSY